MDALVTAAGPMPDSLRAVCDADYKCLLPVDGVRLIDRCLGALHAADSVGRVCLVAPPALRDSLPLREGDLWVDDQGSGHANFMAGLAALADQEQILFVASDVPFVNAAGLDDLVARAPAGIGFALPIYARADVERVLPDATNKYVPFVEGDLTATSVMVVSPTLMAAHRERVETLFNARKHFARLFAMIGLGTAVRFLLAMKLGWRLLRVADLEARIARLLGFPVQALFGCDPVFNFDIDHDRDWRECLALLEHRRAAAG
jgi:CTP:molybdopterin cytidylyltransferase MocA